MARSRNLGYGEGSVYQEKDGRWRGEFRIGSKRRRVSGSTRREALAELDEIRAQAEGGLPLGNDVRLGVWLEAFRSRVMGDRDPNTLANYDWAIGHLQPLHKRRIRDLEVADVENLLRDLAVQAPSPRTRGRGGRRRPLGKSSLNRIKTVLGAALNEAQRLDMIGRNVARLAVIPTEATSAMPRRSLKQDEARRLIDLVAGQKDEALVLCFLCFGLRPGEICGLQWNAINFSDETIQIHQSLKRHPDGSLSIGPTKADSDRTLKLSPELASVLRRHRATQRKQRLAASAWEDHDLVFCNEIGRPTDPSNLRRTIGRLVEAAGLGPLSPNELRHTSTSLHVEFTPIHEVADMLGHKNMRMLTQTYRHKVRSVVDATHGQSQILSG